MPLCVCVCVCVCVRREALRYGFVQGGQAKVVNKVVKTRTQTHSCTSICNEEIKTAEQAQVQHVTLEIKATTARRNSQPALNLDIKLPACAFGL